MCLCVGKGGVYVGGRCCVCVQKEYGVCFGGGEVVYVRPNPEEY